MFQRAIVFLERKFGLHYYLIPGLLLDQSKALGQLGSGFGERLSLLDRAVNICELSVGRAKDQDVGQLALVLKACAECYEEAGSFVEAEERWAKCVAAFEKVCSFLGGLALCATVFMLCLTRSVRSGGPLLSR